MKTTPFHAVGQVTTSATSSSQAYSGSERPMLTVDGVLKLVRVKLGDDLILLLSDIIHVEAHR
jgi:hypothetical protein